MNTVRQQIARNIKKFRTERGYSVEEVGAAVGRSGKTVSAWEVGHGQPDADMLLVLCRFFGVDIADFYGSTGEYTAEEKRLVDRFRAMDTAGRRAFLVIADALSQEFGN